MLFWLPYRNKNKFDPIWGSWNELHIVLLQLGYFFRCQKHFFSANVAIEYIEKLDDQQLKEVDVIDHVELPPEKLDDVSD